MNEMELNSNHRPPSDLRHIEWGLDYTDIDLRHIEWGLCDTDFGLCDTDFEKWIKQMEADNLLWLLKMDINMSTERRASVMEEIISLKVRILELNRNASFKRKARLLEDIISLKLELLELDTHMSTERKASLMEEIISLKLELLKLDTNMSIGKKASLREDIISLKVEMLDLNPKMSKENVFKLMKDVITWEENDIELMLKESELKQNRSMESRTRLVVKVAEMEERVIVLKEKLLSLEQNMSRTNRKEMVREVLESREGVIGLKECIIERKLEQIYLKSDLPWETQAHLMEEVKALKEDVLYKKLELIRLTPHTSKKCVRMLEEVKVMQEELVRIKNKVQIMENNALKIEAILCRHFHALMVAVVAYLMFCAVVTKSVFQKQCLMKHSFVLAALFILWTSGDVEKHPGPWSILVFASIRALLTRLVKHLQGTAVANWGIEPPFWNRNIVFKDINKIKDSDNAEKYAMFYAALQATITKFGRFPDWCREEMVFVETGNEVELQKCQTARKVRELLKPYQGQDVDDILRRAGLPRQTGNPSLSAAASPTQPSSSTVVRHQRPQKCPYNVPGYRPITEITDAATAGLIAEGCMAQSKNAGNIRSKPSNKRQATTSAVAPAPKQQRLTTNQIPTATVSPSSQPGQSGIVSHTLAFIIPAQALTVTASPSDVSTTSRRVPVTSTIVRPPATISTTSQASLTSPPQPASVSMTTSHQVTPMQTSNNNLTASSTALPSPSTSTSRFLGVATSTTGISKTSTTNLRSTSQPITTDTTQQGTMQQTSSDSSTNSSTTPSGPSPSGRSQVNPVSLPSDLQDLDPSVDFNLEELDKKYDITHFDDILL